MTEWHTLIGLQLPWNVFTLSGGMRYGNNLHAIWAQLRNPLLLLLVFAAVLSAVTKEWIDAIVVLSIVLATVGIGSAREYNAQAAAETLKKRIHTKTKVVRDNQSQTIFLEEVVPGDIVERWKHCPCGFCDSRVN